MSAVPEIDSFRNVGGISLVFFFFFPEIQMFSALAHSLSFVLLAMWLIILMVY